MNFDQLVAARQQAKLDTDNIDPDLDPDAYNQALHKQRTLSEALGEMSTDAYVRTNYPDAVALDYSLPGSGSSGQFDRVYVYEQDGVQRVLIVESTGGRVNFRFPIGFG